MEKTHEKAEKQSTSCCYDEDIFLEGVRIMTTVNAN